MEIPVGLVKDSLEHTIETLSKCFCNDTFQRYLVFDHLEIPDSETLNAHLNKREFEEAVPALVEDGATLITVPGSGIASVWHLETLIEGDPDDDEHLPRVLKEMNAKADKARKRVLAPPRKVLHLVLIANNREHLSTDGRKTHASDVIRPMLGMASSQGWPVVLEATSPRSRDIYARLGFRVAEKLQLGVGRVDSDAHRLEGGPGIEVWAMVFEP